MLDEEPLCVLLPVSLDQDEVRELEALARGVRPARDVFVNQPLEIIFGTAPERDLPVEIKVVGHGHERPVLAHSRLTLKAHQSSLTADDICGIPDGYHGVHMTIGSGTGSVTRVIDAAFMSSISPLPAEASLAARKRQALEYSARFGANRVGRLIAMMETGHHDQESFDRIIEATLASIDAREDCSDFIMVPLLWLLGAYADRMPDAVVDSHPAFRPLLPLLGRRAGQRRDVVLEREPCALLSYQPVAGRTSLARRGVFGLGPHGAAAGGTWPASGSAAGSTASKPMVWRSGTRRPITRSISSACWRWSAGLRRPMPSAPAPRSISSSA